MELTNEVLKESGVSSGPGVGVAIEAVSPACADWPRLWDRLVADLTAAVGPDALFTEGIGAPTSEKFFDGGRAKTSASFEGEVTLALIKVRHHVDTNRADKTCPDEGGGTLIDIDQWRGLLETGFDQYKQARSIGIVASLCGF